MPSKLRRRSSFSGREKRFGIGNEFADHAVPEVLSGDDKPANGKKASLQVKGLPPLNLGLVHAKSQAEYDAIVVERPHTSQNVRMRRRSMNDLKEKRQRDYENLVLSMGLNVNRGVEVEGALGLEVISGSRQAAVAPGAESVPVSLGEIAKAARKSVEVLPSVGGAAVVDSKPGATTTTASPHDANENAGSTSSHKKEPRVSIQGLSRAHSFYRKLYSAATPAILDERAAKAEKTSPTARYVSLTRELNIIPNTIIGSVIESVEKEGVVELSSSSLGDDMAVALSHSISVLFVLSMNLSRNHLTDKGICALVHSLDPHVVVELNLAFLKVKKKPAECLSELLGESSTLKKLILEKCDIDDSCLRELSRNIATQLCPMTDMPLHLCTLTTLNLSHNKFGDSGAVSLAEGLKTNVSITELDLSYNLIRGKGGIAIFEALNDSVVCTLDLAYNALRESPGDQGIGVAQAVSACLADNETLVHLSLAYVGFGGEDCVIIGDGLKYNQTLMGLHMEGNHSDIDAHGYMVGAPLHDAAAAVAGEHHSSAATGIVANHDGDHKVAPIGHVFTRILPWAFPKVSNAAETWEKTRSGKCWICDRWNEVKFTLDCPMVERVGQVNEKEEENASNFPVSGAQICTNFDDWKLEGMKKESKDRYEITRMVPPGGVGFFFNLLRKKAATKNYEEEEVMGACYVLDNTQAKKNLDDLVGKSR